jgi:hypothetical protein
MHESEDQAGVEVRLFDDGLQVAPNPAGLEMSPGNGLISTRDDEKMANSEVSQKAQLRRKYYRLRTRTFWIILVLLILVITAIAVGAGIGASQHVVAKVPTSSSSTPTQTISTVAASATAENGGCENGTTYIASSNQRPFKEVCNTDFGVGENYNTSAVNWLEVSNVATFEACMDACALDQSEGLTVDVAGTCLSVTWVSEHGGSGSGFGGCYMKNATALIGSLNETAQMMHARPHAAVGLQSANMVNGYGQIL